MGKNQKKTLRKTITFIAFLMFVTTSTASTTNENDSLRAVNDTTHQSQLLKKIDGIGRQRWFQATYIGVPFIIGGLLEGHYDTDFRSLRNNFMPKFHYTLDNYLQLTPTAVMVGLKAIGVPSRSSWERMVVSNVISVALMTGVVQGLKHTTRVTRPDGSNKQSFPSGHTATAFMAATMLTKEYGHLSPWIGVAAYSMATTTGLMRVANNKHWLSDVLVGAGFGILSTEFGYWIADAIMKERGLNIHPTQEAMEIGLSKPSFIGVYTGFNVPLSQYDVNEAVEYKFSAGTTIGAEGAWFFNHYLGIGARATVSNSHIIVNEKEASENTLDFYNISAGPYFSVPLTPRWRIGTKALIGYIGYKDTNIGGVDVPSSCGISYGSGLSLDYRLKRNFAFGGFTDYNLLPAHSVSSKEHIHTLTLGFRAAINF
ncbi:PAP2 family protein [Prevotella sp. DNF00663]|uniref:phosphatase PAP2 family protein n=1 Tax=unclassified Prevotella TaxID=2638335 RepID=UPI0007922E8F|nr:MULTISPECIES: phosphatase PAP2 family protein [unclassified Prevotella]KXB82364.1 PAP2 family protein [Prevotella sp. DNF00663]